MASSSPSARSSSTTLPSPSASRSASVIDVDPTSTETRSDTPASRSKFGATAIFLLSRRSRAAFGASLMSLIVGYSFNTVDQDGRVAVGLADAAGREIAAGDGYRNMKIGRASCRGRGCPYGEISGGDVY